MRFWSLGQAEDFSEMHYVASYSLSVFSCLIKRCWTSNFLKEGYSYTLCFPISLHNTFSVPLGWHQLQEYVTSIHFFVLPHVLWGIFKLARLWNYKNEKDWGVLGCIKGTFHGLCSLRVMHNQVSDSAQIYLESVLYHWLHYQLLQSQGGKRRPHLSAHTDI